MVKICVLSAFLSHLYGFFNQLDEWVNKSSDSDERNQIYWLDYFVACVRASVSLVFVKILCVRAGRLHQRGEILSPAPTTAGKLFQRKGRLI